MRRRSRPWCASASGIGLRFDYFSLDRTGQLTVTQPIVFRDVVLQPGDPLNSDLSIRTFGITSNIPFSTAIGTRWAATIGLNDTDISARARGRRRRGMRSDPKIMQVPFRRSDSTRPTW